MSATKNKPAKSENESRLSDATYQRLLDDILSGRRRPGAPLSELALTRELKVSRTPVHLAILQLIKDGLVEQEPNCRPVVRGFTARDVHEMFEMRILLEGETARLAATRMKRVALDKLLRLHQKLGARKNRASWLKSWVDYDETFHRTIAEGAANARLASDVLRYRLLHRGLNVIGFAEDQAPLDTLRGAVDEHARILDALAVNDPEAARDAMRVHLRNWQRFFASLFDRDSDSLAGSPNLILFDETVSS